MHTHVDDLVNHVLYEDLYPIVLLGFSYGGMVVTGVGPHIADRDGVERRVRLGDDVVNSSSAAMYTISSVTRDRRRPCGTGSR